MARSHSGDDIANRILLSLPQATLRRLWPVLELRAMKKGEVFNRLGQRIDYLHFVNSGLISLVKTMQDGRSVEIGVVGIEGISNPHALFGINKAILETMVQIPGTTFRIRRDNLRDIMAKDGVLGRALAKYAHFSIAALRRPLPVIAFIISKNAAVAGC